MYRVIIYSILFLVGSKGFAQEKGIGTVNYSMTITQPDGVSYTNPYTLYFNEKTSFFVKVGSAKRVNNITEQEVSNIDETQVTDRVIKNNLPQPFYYTDVKKQELIFREIIVRKLYVIEDTIEPISWKLEQDHKKIGDYSCQKAIATYRGRVYTVWFTADIPVSHGPWKLRGLPGLILEVTEETGKYAFIANTIHMNPDSKLLMEKLVRPNTQGIESMEVYIEALKNKLKDWEAIMIASMPRGARPLRGCDICPDPNNHSLERFH